ncbi:DUF2529 family protein [Alteribacillus bidgolensis]|uniref:DUF2529 domain-containing protein n=1 Tax=Alteribacillus bidgolensis TaxID=930129 RepID=A0A1G8M091_9BACI|nr:DUF2529 family protein [Alteribacillus bidgolensis]SDI61346.1 protein of unknown function [Alteribacillus bidgolensis]
MKIFATQLQGVFQRILDQEEEAIENGARLAAQGPAGTGRLLIYATPSMRGNAVNLTYHPDAPPQTIQVIDTKEFKPESVDRAIVLAEKEEAAYLHSIIELLQSADVPVVVIAPFTEEEARMTLEPTDVWIHTHVRGGIVPDEHGSRIGYPSVLSTLFTGQLLYLNIKELFDELE